MSCARTREWLRTADPATLEDPPGALRAHLADCARCDFALRRTRTALGLLRARLEDAGPTMTASRAVRVAIAGGRAGVGGRAPAASGRPRSARRFGRYGRLAWYLAPVSVAAVAVLLWLARPTEAPDAGRRGASELAGNGGAGVEVEQTIFAVEVPAGHRLAVFQTPNPRIHVVWLYQSVQPVEGELQ